MTILIDNCTDVTEGEVLDLPTLATRANRWHANAGNAHRSMVESAVRAGEALLAAKSLCRHGTWTAWLAANFNASHDTANKYMRCARNSECILNLEPERSLSEALHRISTLWTPPPPAPPPAEPEPCLWGGLPNPGAQQVDLPLRPNTPEAQPITPEEQSRVAEPIEWTDAQRERMAAAWKLRLHGAVSDVDKAIGRLVAAVHEAHPPGSPDGDAKTQARLAANVSRWVETLTGAIIEAETRRRAAGA
jgi:Protein of unknown function (DUF3102)